MTEQNREFIILKEILKFFKEKFMTVFKRRLTTLFTRYADEDFYILSDESPYYLMSGNSKTSYGFVDLSHESEEIRQGIRDMVTFIGGTNMALRSDLLTQLFENYKGTPFPEPVTATNSDKEDVWVYWRRRGIADYPPEKIRRIIGDKDFKDKHSNHLLKAGWPLEGGYFNLPLERLKQLYHDYIEKDWMKADFIPGSREDLSPVTFAYGKNQYRLTPVPGHDTLDLDKVKTLLGSRMLLKEESLYVFSYASFASIGTQERYTNVMITRPDLILYPHTRSSP